MRSQIEKANAIINNDQRELKKLYVENYWKIKTYILQNSGTEEHAKDVYQEAFVRMWRNLKNQKFYPQSENAIENYLYLIAKNKWIDHLRSPQFKKVIHVEEFESYHHQENSNPEETEQIFSDQLNVAMSSFAKMEKECRELLKLFYFEKKSLAEIAQQFHIHENSARNKKYRCVQKLRELVNNAKNEKS